eukprot:CFRG5357T1
MTKKSRKSGSDGERSGSNLRIVFKLGGGASSAVPSEYLSSGSESSDGEGDESASNASKSNHKPSVIKLKLQPASPSVTDFTSANGNTNAYPISKKRGRAMSEESVTSNKKRKSRGTSPVSLNVSGTVPDITTENLLTDTLARVHDALVAKDTHMFFTYPVDNSIAPKYDEIIKHPMDFSTMHGNILAHKYASIDEYGEHFALMCNNAMIYNQDITIYHKTAKRLLKQGSSLLKREKKNYVKQLKALAKAASTPKRNERANSLSVAPTSDEEDSEMEGMGSPGMGNGTDDISVGGVAVRRQSTSLEAEQVKACAAEEARKAAEAVHRTTERPHRLVFDERGNLVFSEQESVTQMPFLSNERAGAITGRTLGEEIDLLPTAHPLTIEDKKDGRYSQLTPAQQKVVDSSFGDEHVYAYARFLRQRATSDIATPTENDRVDALLTQVTDGRYHRKEWPVRGLTSELKEYKLEDAPPVTCDDLKVLNSLREEGIDMKWLDCMFKPGDVSIRRVPTSVQDVLDDTAGLLWELEKVQAIRKATAFNLSYKPDERALAQEIVSRLKQLLAITYHQ